MLVLGLSTIVAAQGTSPTSPTAPKTTQPTKEAQTGTGSQPVKPEAAPVAQPAKDWSAKLSEIFATTEPVTVADGFKFAEGPLWWKDRLLVCDLSGNAVYSVTPKDGEIVKPTDFRRPSDNAAGAALDTDGNLILAHFAGKLTRTNADGTVEVIGDRMGEAAFGKCNDLVCHPSGVIFFTDFGGKESKGLFARAKDGTITQVDAEYQAANGVALSPDNKTLYVADYAIWIIRAYDVDADGNATNGRELTTLKGQKGRGRADGVKVTPSGHVLATGPGGIWVITPEGEKHSCLPIVGGASNLAIGGPDGKTVYITAGDKVVSVKLK